MELLIEKSRAAHCFFQHKIMKRSLRDVAKELGMSYERIRHLADRAEKVYGMKIDDFAAKTKTDQR